MLTLLRENASGLASIIANITCCVVTESSVRAALAIFQRESPDFVCPRGVNRSLPPPRLAFFNKLLSIRLTLLGGTGSGSNAINSSTSLAESGTDSSTTGNIGLGFSGTNGSSSAGGASTGSGLMIAAAASGRSSFTGSIGVTVGSIEGSSTGVGSAANNSILSSLTGVSSKVGCSISAAI